MRALSRRKAEKGEEDDLEQAGQNFGGSRPTSSAGPPAVDGAEEDTPRRVFVNTPLAPELLDEDGSPVQQFSRNKIRTAKYTPLIFIPKNLWLQFHNIANVYFLFVTILAVSLCLP